MSTWKILIIGLLGSVCVALAMATIAIPMAHEGSQRWLWLGGLLSGTLFTGTLLGFFLRYAGRALDLSPHKIGR